MRKRIKLKNPIIIHQESNKKVGNTHKIHMYGGVKQIMAIEKAHKKLPSATFPSSSIKLHFNDGSTAYVSFFRSSIMRDIAFNKIVEASDNKERRILLDYPTYFGRVYPKGVKESTIRKKINSLVVLEEDLKSLKSSYDKIANVPLNISALAKRTLWGANPEENYKILLDIVMNLDIPDSFKEMGVPRDTFWKIYLNFKHSKNGRE